MTDSVYAACERLFRDYQPAVRTIDLAGTLDMMVLMNVSGDDAAFFTLARDREDKLFYTVTQWGGQDRADIEAGGDVPQPVADAVSRALPLPRDGSLFGWVDGGEVTAVIAFYCDTDDDYPVFSVMPRADAAPGQWPPVQALFGPWFWDAHRAGQAVSLAPVIARSPGRFFWVPGTQSGMLVVGETLREPVTVPAGVYAYHQAVRDGEVPPLADVTADPRRADLAPRFQP